MPTRGLERTRGGCDDDDEDEASRFELEGEKRMGREVENARAWVDETSTRDSTELLYRVVAALREVSDDVIVDRVCKRTFWRTNASMGRQLARLRCAWLRSQRSWAGNVGVAVQLGAWPEDEKPPGCRRNFVAELHQAVLLVLAVGGASPARDKSPAPKKSCPPPSPQATTQQADPPTTGSSTTRSGSNSGLAGGRQFKRNTTSNTALRKLAFCTPTRLFAQRAPVHRFPDRLRKLHITC